jgi:Predicted nucleotide-binding protein containing TIR-like domain
MSYLVRTFASYLKHFSKTVGVVDDHTFDRVRDLVYRYVRDELEADYFELMEERLIDGKPGLMTFWSSDNRTQGSIIRSQDDSYSTMMAVSFDQARPLWVVNPEGHPLRDSTSHVDLWSGLFDLPSYTSLSDRPTRTLIVVPLRLRRTLGVLYLETTRYIGITEVAKEELTQLADALAILFELWSSNRLRDSLAQEAILDLRDVLGQARFPKLAKPKIFVSYSNRADAQVVAVIHDVLNEFEDMIDMASWNQISHSGSVTTQIAENILTSTFGICYFSEPAKDEFVAEHAYVDNSNVVFEAGMLHALTNSADNEPRGWIPIREEDSSPPPFDFSAERIQYVPRTRHGEMNESRFREQLRRWINTLLQQD